MGAAVRLLGAAGQLGFVVTPHGGRCFSGYVSGDGDHTDVFSKPRSSKCAMELESETSEHGKTAVEADPQGLPDYDMEILQ